MQSEGQLRFGAYRLDAADGKLWRGRQAVPLTLKAFAVLEHLVRRAGRLVTKEQLLRAVWADSLVTDASLKVAIREVRKALGDDPAKPRFIETAHRRGYRFVAAVEAPPATDGREGKAPAEPRSTQYAVLSTQYAVPHGSTEASSSRGPSSRPYTSGYLVGRAAELATLHACLQRAVGGQRQVVFLTGEPGSGKTALLEGFTRELAEAPVRLAVGQCFEHFGRGEAYLPVLDALQRLARELPAGTLEPLVARHAPAWQAQLVRPDGPAGPREPLGTTGERVLRELAELVEALAARTPLVLVLEDLHWCDYSTLDLISLLATRRDPVPLLLLGTYRPVEAILSEHPLRQVQHELQAHHFCTELPLGPLGADAVADYLRQRFPGRAISPALAGQLHRHTEGLPLFLLNLLDYLLAHGALFLSDEEVELVQDLGRVDFEVPEGVRSMIEKQTERLTAAERALLEAASVAGSEFSAAAVAAALEQDVVAAEDLCEGLARRQLFLEEAGGADWPDGTVASRYRFRHDLYRGAFYQRLAAARRARLHARVGRRLEAAYGPRAGEVAAELALHFEQGRDAAGAVRWLGEAARRAVRRYANREALDYLHRALEQVPRLAPAEQEPAGMRLREQRGLVRRATNDMAGAAADFEALAAAARRQGQTEEEARALIHLASVVSWVDRPRCLGVAEELVVLSGRLGDPLWRAHARGQAGFFNLLMRGWAAEDAGAVADAVAASRAAGDGSLLGVHLRQYAFVQSVQSAYAAAAADASEAAQLARDRGDASEYLVSRFFQAWAQMHQGDWGAMLPVLREAARIAEENGHRRWVVMFRYGLAWLSLQVYDFEKARGLIEHSLEEVKVHEFPYGELIGPVLLGFAHFGLGDLDRAAACFEGMAARLARERLILDWVWWMLLHLGRAELWLRQGDYGKARAEADALCEAAERPGEVTYLALGLRARATAALAEGDRKQAEADLDRAAALVEQTHAPLAAGPVYAALARLHARQKRRVDAAAAQARCDAVLAALTHSLAEEPALQASFASGRSVLQYCPPTP